MIHDFFQGFVNKLSILSSIKLHDEKGISMKKLMLLLSLAFAATQSQAITIEDCSNLLPEGYKFKINMEADIDTSKPNDKVSGMIKVIPQQDIPDYLAFDEKPFVECVVQLIKVNRYRDQ